MRFQLECSSQRDYVVIAFESAPAGVPDPELPMLYCPVCSQRLASRKCKLFCERCGYYMSCADYY